MVSTFVKTNSYRNREPFSDLEASKTLGHSASASGGKEWDVGFKAHLVADTNHDIPLAWALTTAIQGDANYLVPMVEETVPTPGVVIADRGYNPKENSEWLHRRGIAPAIHKRRSQIGVYADENGKNGSQRSVERPSATEGCTRGSVVPRSLPNDF